jgi:hypothetical protein
MPHPRFARFGKASAGGRAAPASLTHCMTHSLPRQLCSAGCGVGGAAAPGALLLCFAPPRQKAKPPPAAAAEAAAAYRQVFEDAIGRLAWDPAVDVALAMASFRCVCLSVCLSALCCQQRGTCRPGHEAAAPPEGGLLFVGKL